MNKIDKAENELKFLKKRFKVPLYDHLTITIVVTDCMSEAFKRITNAELEYESLGMFFHQGRQDIHLILNEGEDGNGLEGHKLSAGCIAHEAFHATKYIMDYVGMELNDASEEAYTYLLQWITDTSIDLLDKYQIKYK